MPTRVQKVITLEPEEILEFCGENDRKLRRIRDRFDAKILARGNEIRISGEAEPVERAHRMIRDLVEAGRSGGRPVNDHQLHHHLIQSGIRPETPRGELLGETVDLPNTRLRLSPLTRAQSEYLKAIRSGPVTICTGPAGTGKTYLAMAMAVSHLISGQVSRIILVRPAVEAGERLGFLPGDIAQKFDPYVRPLYDALQDMMDSSRMHEFIENGTIEIAPLAFMRGRTLNKSFVILDEAQNTTIEQMKMFLTRLGFQSKLVITGDITQIDLPKGRPSGLIHATDVLSGIPEIAMVGFDRKDVVRHELVQKIVEAYEADGKE